MNAVLHDFEGFWIPCAGEGCTHCPPPPQCECGSAAIKAPTHSDWCPCYTHWE